MIDHFYADNEKIYTSFPLLPEHSGQRTAFSRISNCEGEAKRRMTDTNIKFNDSKTAAFVVCKNTSFHKLEDQPLVIGEPSISPSASVHDLGVTINHCLTMQQ